MEISNDDCAELSVSEPYVEANNEKYIEEPCETYIVIPPDGGWGWMVVLGAFFAFLISDGLIYSFGVFLKELSHSFGCAKSNVAMTGAITSGFFCLTGPFAAALVNRFGYHRIIIFGSGLACFSCILTSFTSSIYLTYLTYGFIGGVGYCLIYFPATIAVGFYFEKWRALATGISVCGSGIGGIVLPPILTFFIERLGWRYTFQIMGALSLACSACAVLLRPLKPVLIKNVPIKLSDVESKEKSKVFGRFHNASHPTIAEVHSKSRPAINILEPNLQTPTNNSEKPTISTVTIYRLKKLEAKTSSEFVMSTTPSKGSFKPNTAKEACVACDSKLSTIFEEVKVRDGGKCRCCKNEQNDEDETYCQFCDCVICSSCYTIERTVDETTINRPLYRDDIFYSGSLLHVPEYKKHSVSQLKDQTIAPAVTKSKSSIDYIMHVTRTITQKELNEVGTCKLCTEAVKRTLATMLDINLLKSRPFILLVCHAIFTSMGSYTPYMFIQDRASQYGIPEETGIWLISAIGVANTLGRMICGIVSSFGIVNSTHLSCVSLFIGGIFTMISGMITSLWGQFAYAALYGLSIACMSALRTIIMVETLGLEKLTNAIGIMLMFQGIALLGGTAFSGLLRDVTGNYDMSFYFAGGCISLSSFFLLPIKSIETATTKRTKR